MARGDLRRCVALLGSAVVLAAPTVPARAGVDALPGTPPRIVLVADDTAVPARVREATVRELSRALRVASDFCSFDYRGPVRLVLVSTPQQFAQVAGSDSGDVLAVADPAGGAIAVSPASWRGDPSRAGSVLLHEASHLVLGAKFAAANTPLPRWLAEGVTQYVANDWEFDVDWSAQQGQIMDEVVTAGTLAPLDRLDSLFAGDRGNVQLAYAESYSFVAYLASAYGRQALRRFIDAAAARGATPDSAARGVFGVGLEKAQTEWRDSVARRSGWWEVLLGSSNFLTLLWTFLALLVVLGFALVTYRKRKVYEAMDRYDGHDDYALPSSCDDDERDDDWMDREGGPE